MKKLFLIITLFTSIHASAQSDLALLDVYPVEYARAGGLHPFYGLGDNNGSQGIAYADVTVHWQFNGGVVQSDVAQSTTTWISVNQTKELTNPNFQFQTPTTEGRYTLKVWVTMVDPDIDHSNDTIIKTVKVIANLPQKNVMLETFKHQTCGPCWSGDTMIKGSIDILPYYNSINIYTASGEVCYSADGDALEMGLGPYAHPTVVFDHYVFPHETNLGQSFYTLNGNKYLENLYRREEFLEPVDVRFKTLDIDKVNRTLTMDITAKFYDTLNKDLRFNVYVLEDSVFGYQASAPNPNNYWHSKVLRKILGGIWGVQNSIPLTVYTGQEITKNFTYTVPAAINMKNIRLVAMVQEYNSNKKQRKIWNSKKAFVRDYWNFPTTVVDAVAANIINIYPNPVQDILNINTENLGDYVVRVFNPVGQLLIQSENSSQLNISALPVGSYYLEITSKKGRFVESFIKK